MSDTELATLKVTQKNGVKTYHAMYKGTILLSSTGRNAAKVYVRKFNLNIQARRKGTM